MQYTCAILYVLVAYPAVTYFSKLLERCDFRRNIIEHTTYVWYPLHLPETFILLEGIERDIVININRS